MGRPLPHPPVTLIVGMLSAHPRLLDLAEKSLVENFGPVSLSTVNMPFNYTTYYEDEMGTGLLRKFLSFANQIRADELAEIKLWTNALEERIAAEAQSGIPRPINLDPGYVELSRLVLATTKDHAHRVFLGRGIYAEVTLIWQKGAFQPQPWTYPDYRTDEYRNFFASVRAALPRTTA